MQTIKIKIYKFEELSEEAKAFVLKTFSKEEVEFYEFFANGEIYIEQERGLTC